MTELSPSQTKSVSTGSLLLVLFLIYELPVRLLLQPDPWLLGPGHWYFSQPLRLITEYGLLISMLLITFRFVPSLLKVPRHCYPHLVIGMLICIPLFAVLEWRQLNASLDAPVYLFLMWLLSGFAIGMGQELLYRGWLFTSLRARMSSGWASAVTTLIFVLAPLHSVRLWDYSLQGEFTVVLILISIYVGVSYAFQWLRDVSQSALLPGLVHGAGNAITWAAVFTTV